MCCWNARRWVAACFILTSVTPALLLADPPSPVPVVPNLLVEVNQEFLDAIGTTTDTKPDTINKNEKGTRTVGSQVTYTRVNIDTVPSAQYGRIDLVLTGITYACTDTQRDRIYLGNDVRIRYCSRKSIIIDETGIRETEAQTTPYVQNDLRYLHPDYCCVIRPVIKRIALRVYHGQEPKLNRDIGNDAAKQLSEEFDKRTKEQLKDINERYQKDYREPMKEKGIFPQRVRVLSSDDQLGIRALLMDDKATTPPTFAPVPNIHGCPDVALRMEESLMNNITQKLYGGRELTGEELDDELNELMGSIAGEMKTTDPNEKPFTIKFQDQRPWVFRFDDQKLSVTIRGQEFSYGDDVYDAMDITATYSLRKTPTGLIVERVGDLRIYPPGFVEGRDRLPARQKLIRDLLDRKLSQRFPPIKEFEAIDLPESLKNAGRLITTQVSSDDGWLVLAWRHVPKPPKPPKPPEEKKETAAESQKAPN